MRTTTQLHERATLAVTPLAMVIAQVPNVRPDGGSAPGGKGLQEAINVFAFYGILAPSRAFCWVARSGLSAGAEATSTPPRAARSAWRSRSGSRF